jgi:hypothetical protein
MKAGERTLLGGWSADRDQRSRLKMSDLSLRVADIRHKARFMGSLVA